MSTMHEPILAGRVPRGPFVSGSLALLIAFGTSQTWARAFIIGIAGTDADRGIITLLAALAGAIVCAWRILFGLKDRWYFGFGITTAFIAFLMPLWFLVDIVTEPKDDFFDARIVTASWGLYLTLAAAAGYAISVIVSFVSRDHPC